MFKFSVISVCMHRFSTWDQSNSATALPWAHTFLLHTFTCSSQRGPRLSLVSLRDQQACKIFLEHQFQATQRSSYPTKEESNSVITAKLQKCQLQSYCDVSLNGLGQQPWRNPKVMSSQQGTNKRNFFHLVFMALSGSCGLHGCRKPSGAWPWWWMWHTLPFLSLGPSSQAVLTLGATWEGTPNKGLCCPDKHLQFPKILPWLSRSCPKEWQTRQKSELTPRWMRSMFTSRVFKPF